MAKKKANDINDAQEAEVTKVNPDQTNNSEEQSTSTAKKITVKARARKKSDLAVPLIADLIMLVMGICMLAWPDKILSTISIIIGVVLLVYAIYNIIKYIRIEEKSNGDLPLLVTGIAVAIAGSFLIIQSHFIEAFFSIVIGIILTVSSIMHLQDALAYKSEDKLPLILSIITLVCGILCLFGKMMPIQIMIIFIGVILVIYSLADIVQSMVVYKKK